MDVRTFAAEHRARMPAGDRLARVAGRGELRYAFEELSPAGDGWAEVQGFGGLNVFQTRPWVEYVAAEHHGEPVLVRVLRDGAVAGHFVGLKVSQFGGALPPRREEGVSHPRARQRRIDADRAQERSRPPGNRVAPVVHCRHESGRGPRVSNDRQHTRECEARPTATKESAVEAHRIDGPDRDPAGHPPGVSLHHRHGGLVVDETQVELPEERLAKA